MGKQHTAGDSLDWVIYQSWKPNFVSVEGNYGAGKTLLVELMLQRLKSRLISDSRIITGFEAMPELFELNPHLVSQLETTKRNFRKMRAGGNGTYDPVFYRSQDFFLDLDREQKKKAVEILERSNCIDDRSCEGDAIYEQNFYNLGWITDEEHHGYQQKFGEIAALQPSPILRIYLSVEPELLYKERIPNRGRIMEEGVPLEYIVRLHELHESWIQKLIDADSQSVLIIDNGPDINLKESHEDQTYVLRQIKHRLDQLNHS